jgi:hypothetical protein
MKKYLLPLVKFVKNKYFFRLIRILFLGVTILLLTCWIIAKHTPSLPDITFDFSCPNPMSPCVAIINEGKNTSFEQGVKASIRLSHRLGKLSDIYISVIRFRLDLYNKTDMNVSVSSTGQSIKTQGMAICTDTVMNYGDLITLEKDFILSDSSEDLFKTVIGYITTCTSYPSNNQLPKEKIIVPPNQIITFDLEPTFTPKLVPDILSWIIVYVFNILIVVGLLPIIREICRLITKGYKKYFTD